MIGAFSAGLLSTAWAVDVGGRPPVASDLFRPSVDGGRYLASEESTIASGATAGLHLSWAREPLRIVVDGEASPVVADAVAMHLGARWGFGPLQVGVSAPGYLVARVGENRTVLGDPTLDLKLAKRFERFGGGLFARLGTSLGASDWLLGYPGPFAEFGAVGEFELSPVHVVANLGVRATPEQVLGDIVLDDAFWFRIGASVSLSDRVRPGLELLGQRTLSGSGPPVTPVEGLAQLHYRWAPAAGLNAGVGTGLTPGIGSPRWRVVAGATFVPGRQVAPDESGSPLRWP